MVNIWESLNNSYKVLKVVQRTRFLKINFKPYRSQGQYLQNRVLKTILSILIEH